MFLMPADGSVVVLDHVELNHGNWVEHRLHTYGEAEIGEGATRIQGWRHRLELRWASNVGGGLRPALGIPTGAGEAVPNVIRWTTAKLESRVTTAVLLTADAEPGEIDVISEGSEIRLQVRTPQVRATYDLDSRLQVRG